MFTVVTIKNVWISPNTYNHKKTLFRACKFDWGPDLIKNLLLALFTIELTTKGLEIKFFIAGILLLMGLLY